MPIVSTSPALVRAIEDSSILAVIRRIMDMTFLRVLDDHGLDETDILLVHHLAWLVLATLFAICPTHIDNDRLPL